MTTYAHSDVVSDGPSDTARVAPTHLADAQQVNALLSRSGMGTLSESSLRSFPGRNPNWAGRTDLGTDVFVKAVTPEALRRSLTFQRSAPEHDPFLRFPRCLASDDDAELMVFELLPDSRACSGPAKEGRLPVEVSREAGRALGRLHGWTVPFAGLPDRAVPLPPLEWIQGLPLALYLECSTAELEAWDLMRQDTELLGALERLRESEAAAEQVPSHGDLRLDQYLLSGSCLYLTDWEEFGYSDAARDIGAYVGEWLYLTALEAAADTSDAAAVEGMPARAIARFREVAPHIEAFWAGYRSVRRVEPDLRVRASGWAGWHMFDRLIAAAGDQPRLSAATRAAAGIGRQALLRPEAASGLLFPSEALNGGGAL